MKPLINTVFGSAALALSLAHCHAAQPPSCPTPAGVKAIHRMSALPDPVRQALKAKLGNIVDSDQPFDDVDVVRYGGHFDRFAFAWQNGSGWIVITEHGGIAYSNPVYLFRYQSGDTKADLVTSTRSYRDPVCTVAAQLLSNSTK